MDVRGATCLVTGASSGIGRATALALARAGGNVIASGRDLRALEEVAAMLMLPAFAADLADPTQIDRLAGFADRVDVVVNNAGEGWAGRFVDIPPDRIGELIQTNLAATIRLTRALLPGMLDRGRGHIVNVASIVGHLGVRDEAVYAATKAALIGFSESLRYELGNSGVGISVVSPAAVATAFFDRRGRPYGRRRPAPLPPEQVADAILHAIRTGKPQVFVPRWMAFPAWLRGAAPGMFRWGARRFG